MIRTLLCSTPDMTLTSLHLHESTIMCCDRFDRNCVDMNLKYKQKRAYGEISDIWSHQLGCAEINLFDPSLLPTLLCTLHCVRHAQWCITGTQTFLISKLCGWKHTTAFHKSFESNWHQMYAQTPWTILMLWKSVDSWQQRRTVDPLE